MVYLSNSKEPLYYYRLNRLRFPVSEAGYDALIVGRPYRVYYLPRSKILLSLEPLSLPHPQDKPGEASVADGNV
jgi:hypothetical protein